MKESTEEKPTLVQSTSNTFMHSESDLASFEPPEVAPTTGAMESQGKGPSKVFCSSPSSAKLKFSSLNIFISILSSPQLLGMGGSNYLVVLPDFTAHECSVGTLAATLSWFVLLAHFASLGMLTFFQTTPEASLEST